ncbi:MAG: tetratricopeptide repeat protein [Treponema sp.]
MAEQNEQPLSFSDHCIRFLTENRKPIAVVFAVICVAAAAALTVVSINGRKAKNASIAAETLITEWMELRVKNADDMQAKEDALIEKLEAQAAAAGGTYASFRAYSALGEIYVLRKDWEKGLAAYEKAGQALPKNYTAGIAYFNAAACADELKQYEKALTFYTLSADAEDFPLKPRALFNVGRLHESLSQLDQAVAAYNKLSELYPDNSWTMLAKSRVIALSIQ